MYNEVLSKLIEIITLYNCMNSLLPADQIPDNGSPEIPGVVDPQKAMLYIGIALFRPTPPLL